MPTHENVSNVSSLMPSIRSSELCSGGALTIETYGWQRLSDHRSDMRRKGDGTTPRPMPLQVSVPFLLALLLSAFRKATFEAFI